MMNRASIVIGMALLTYSAIRLMETLTQPSPTTRTYEDGVRDCIEALPKAYLQNPHAACSGPVRLAHEAARAALETLLPDPVEELVREYWESFGQPDLTKYFDGEKERAFARWLTQNYTLEKK